MPVPQRVDLGASHICKNTYSGFFLLPSSSFLLTPDSWLLAPILGLAAKVRCSRRFSCRVGRRAGPEKIIENGAISQDDQLRRNFA
ncbi:hypothetical protein [Microcoleus vaginatus]|uniref:hypothetical protein n=1 Tax=Microcoleus vaginatus TaxID=119532 RepID=UPI001F611DC4